MFLAFLSWFWNLGGTDRPGATSLWSFLGSTFLVFWSFCWNLGGGRWRPGATSGWFLLEMGLALPRPARLDLWPLEASPKMIRNPMFWTHISSILQCPVSLTGKSNAKTIQNIVCHFAYNSQGNENTCTCNVSLYINSPLRHFVWLKYFGNTFVVLSIRTSWSYYNLLLSPGTDHWPIKINRPE